MEWVSFDEIKRVVTLAMVINRYGFKLRTAGPHTLRGKCPLPTHSSEKSKESFIANLNKGVGGAWVCQSDSCVAARNGRRGGNALDLVSVMERCSVRDAAIKLQQWFSVHTSSPDPRTGRQEPPEPQEPGELVSKKREGESEEPNPPLTFTLHGIDPRHPYVGDRGITQETAEAFGIGFFPGKGSMAGRLVIPIHDGWGELVAYAGRSIDTTEPKYKFPVGFRKTLELFNLHRTPDTAQYVIVVEGFFDCMKVHQAGFPSVVGLMGSSLSTAQEGILTDLFSHIVLMLDGDAAGRDAQQEIALRLAAKCFTRCVVLPPEKQPDELSAQEIQNLLSRILAA